MDTHNFDKALTPEEFESRYGKMLAVALWGARKVGSALTRRHYIHFDYATGTYVVEKR